MSQDSPIAGFYGKLPGLGDFVARRLPNQLVQPWDRWLRESLGASRERLGEQWLEVYLTSPLWRFVLSPGLAGQSAWIGVLMPSVDRVGRYFPLTIAAPLPEGVNPVAAVDGSEWFDQAESVALAALDDGFGLDELEARLLALPVPTLAADADLGPGEGNAWQVELGPGVPPSTAIRPLLARALGDLFLAYSLWWTSGSERVEPSLLACQGLPPPEGFAAMLAGDWGSLGWATLGNSQ